MSKIKSLFLLNLGTFIFFLQTFFALFIIAYVCDETQKIVRFNFKNFLIYFIKIIFFIGQ